MPQARVRPYRLLARHYDDIFAPFRAPVDVARHRILKPLLPGVERACDLCCGTGGTALEFAGRGIATFAVDLSPDMCRLTREKARAAGVSIRVLRSDMRDFRLPQPVDLITCEADAINHVPRRSDLGKVVGAVARALRPGGHFYFDVNNLLGFERYWTGIIWIERPDVVLVMRNGNNLRTSKAWSDVEWFVRERRQWSRYQERVEEVCWTPEEIRRALRANGFEAISDWDQGPFFKRDAAVTAGCRTVYLARKR
jgi:SAM-dependent methyltransferase